MNSSEDVWNEIWSRPRTMEQQNTAIQAEKQQDPLPHKILAAVSSATSV